MGRISRANELIVRDSEQTPDLFRALCYCIDQFLRRDFSFGGGLRDFLAVLVHSYQEMNVVALEAMITGYDVGADFLESVTLVWISGGVIDCGGEEVLGQLMAAR